MALEIERIREIAERVAASLGLEIVEVELRGGGKSRMLRLVIDKLVVGANAKPAAGVVDEPGVSDQPGGVTHEDCAKLSREVSTILDVEDAGPSAAYVLEVSSPGLDRKLIRAADYERFTGSRVKLMTRNPVDGNRHFEGRLEIFQQGKLTLDLSTPRKKAKPGTVAPQKVEIELANVEKANLVPEI